VTPTPNPTDTLQPSPIVVQKTLETATAEPTSIPTLVATETPVNEYELKPAYTEKVSQKFMGVQINAELITDESLDPVIKKVTVSETAYAEFIARSVFNIWQNNSEKGKTYPATEDGFKQFMAIWAQAQQSGTGWEEVQFPIWVNDLNDGNGYVQKQETIWPMYSGNAPEGVRGISTISAVLLNGTKIDNMTHFSNSAYLVGFGINIDKEKLYFYAATESVYGFPNLNENTCNGVASFDNWAIRNNGRSFSGDNAFFDTSLKKLLLNNNFSVK
jgi:hypothetical protein